MKYFGYFLVLMASLQANATNYTPARLSNEEKARQLICGMRACRGNDGARQYNSICESMRSGSFRSKDWPVLLIYVGGRSCYCPCQLQYELGALKGIDWPGVGDESEKSRGGGFFSTGH